MILLVFKCDCIKDSGIYSWEVIRGHHYKTLQVPFLLKRRTFKECWTRNIFSKNDNDNFSVFKGKWLQKKMICKFLLHLSLLPQKRIYSTIPRWQYLSLIKSSTILFQPNLPKQSSLSSGTSVDDSTWENLQNLCLNIFLSNWLSCFIFNTCLKKIRQVFFAQLFVYSFGNGCVDETWGLYYKTLRTRNLQKSRKLKEKFTNHINPKLLLL